MPSRQNRRRRRQRGQQEKLAPEILHESTSLNLPESWWKWFWRLSRDKKVPILGVIVAVLALGSLWFWNLVPMVVRLATTPKPDVHVGVAFYAYERGFILLEGKHQTTLAELRNLPSNCSLWRFPQTEPNPSTKVSALHSLVLSKFLLENVSDQRITNLRMAVASPLFKRTTVVSATPNVEAKGRFEATHNDALHTYVISIASMPPHASAIVSLETPMDDALRHFLYDEHGTVSVPLVSLSTDQLTFHSTVARINASTMYKMETEMRTGDKGIAVAEKIEGRILGPSEPEPKDESDRLLPRAKQCEKGTGGNW